MQKKLKTLALSFLLGAYFLTPPTNADTTTNNIPEELNLTINSGESLESNSFYTYKTIDNYGEIQAHSQEFIRGTLNNYGNLFSYNVLSIASGSDTEIDRRIINHAEGNMILMGYMDIYSENALFENSGRFSAIDGLGDNSYPGTAFTYGIKGTIKNTGSFLIDKPAASNACEHGMGGHATIQNNGQFKITQGTNCRFDRLGAVDLTASSTFTQNSGEFIVNGYFSASKVDINNGTISGTGTVSGLSFIIPNKVTLSPGSPYGTLSIIPTGQFIACDRCSVDIELAGQAKIDHLHFEGEFILYRWKLNVLFREGFSPQQGDSFEILSADNIMIVGPLPEYHLPELKSGLNWDVQYNDTNITLTVN
jgi:hypothetical protein